MGINIKNNERIVNAKLGNVTVNDFGRVFAIQYGLDGISIADIQTPLAPQDIKGYLEGDDELTIFPVPSNVSKICVGAFTPFPNIETIYLFKSDSVVVLEDTLSYLSELSKIYVPPNLLDTYKSTYSTIANLFDTWVIDYTLTIPFIGESTLTSEYLDDVLGMLSNAEKNSITKVVIPTDFTQASADYIAWNYDFASYLPNLNDNIWYGETQYDFSTLTISGSGTLTSAIVDSAIQNVSLRINSVTKVIVSTDFNLESVCVILSDYDLSSLTNLNENIYYGSHTCKGVSFATDDTETLSLSAWLDSNCPYALGNTRSVVYNNATYTLRICDNTANRYELTNYSGKYNKFVIEFVEVISSARMNSSNTNYGGFALSKMHTTTLPNIYNNLPSDLKAVISQVSVASASGGTGVQTLSYSDNYLFLPSEYEVFGSRTFSDVIEQTSQYGLYRANNNNNFRSKSPIYWWMRSPRTDGSVSFCRVNADGSKGDNYASLSNGIVVFFCI